MKARVPQKPAPKKTPRQWRMEKRWAGALATVLVLAVLAALMLTVPGFSAWAYRLLGITQVQVPVVGGSDVPVAVHIIDVGQGDAALVEDNGAFALIDAGTPEAKDTLVEYLRLAGVKKLDYLIMTHPHADHIGGMAAVVEAFDVGLAIFPNFDLAPLPTTSTFERLLETMLRKGVATETAVVGQSYTLGAGALHVVHAGVQAEEDYNLMSLGILFESSGLRFLNTGDGEKENERAMLQDGADVSANVFLAGHHGSSTSNTQDFLHAVSPQIVVISCAAGNSYGHPHRSALQAFEAVGAGVLRCDRQGSIVIKPNGSGGLVYAAEKDTAEEAA